MKIFRVCLPIIASLAVLINLLGFDDYNILLMGVSPIAWIREFIPVMQQADLPMYFSYISAILFWFLIGYLLDRLIQRLQTITNK